jgi:hypothetical protein
MMQEPTTFVEVAKMIGDSRLAKPLDQLTRHVEIEVHNAAFIPTATHVRHDIERLNWEARRFEIALNRVSRRLLDLPTDADRTLLKAREVLGDIVELCKKSLKIVSPKRGPRRKPGKLTCAIIVIEAWAFANGKPPSQNNEQAQEACEAYWRACGGKPSGNWQRMLIAARADGSRLRDLIRNEIRRGAE